jgi:glycosidase
VTTVEAHAPQRLADADLSPRGRVFASPVSWRDQLLYFLLPDRFSDGREHERPRFDRSDPRRHLAPDAAAWHEAGRSFQGGTIAGVTSKLDYLADLGVGAIWLGPVWRQRPDLDTYHGYGLQHFCDVDPRFGSRQDLRDLVDAAHDRGMYVLLDVIYNHSGNNFFYDDHGRPVTERPYRFQPPHRLHGWRSSTGQSIPLGDAVGPHDAVWPRKFQNPDWYTRAGSIGRWDTESWEDPLHPDTEFRRGDFFDLKDLNLTRDETLSALIRVYQYWIALTDCDGFRIDTVKHVSREASRNFCGAIREYAEHLGKENFLLLGEVTGGAGMARDYLDIFGRNIDAALDIGDPAVRLMDTVRGLRPAEDLLGLYRESGHDVLGSHREVGRYHVSILDDHDMVGRSKRRFAAGNTFPTREVQTAHAVGTQLTILGIPCLYYGTEQAFDGSEEAARAGSHGHEDRHIRESMFGGTFGAMRTAGCHFFDPEHPTYLRIAAIARLRRANDPLGQALRRGRLYLSQSSPRPDAPPTGVRYRCEKRAALPLMVMMAGVAGAVEAVVRTLADPSVAANTGGTRNRGSSTPTGTRRRGTPTDPKPSCGRTSVSPSAGHRVRSKESLTHPQLCRTSPSTSPAASPPIQTAFRALLRWFVGIVPGSA